ncbi:hypothetical protein CG709_14060, partial [Lachnotalea glycerini]
AVISCKGIDLDKGITESNESEAEIKSIMRKCAKTTILAIDNSKFDNISFIKVGDSNKNDIVITDKMLQDKWNQYFEEREIKVIAE